ncbi:MAG: cytochrome C oxidase subunit IV family protein [Actinomycetota bacterium]
MSDIHVDRSDAEIEEHAASHAGHPSPPEYVRIFFILGAITGIEVAIYYLREGMGVWFLPALFALMISKFAIVVLWYMHLKFDDRRFSRFFVMGLAAAVTLYLVVLISLRVFLN